MERQAGHDVVVCGQNLVDNYDSRKPLADLSDPRVAALVRQREQLQQRIGEG